MYRTWRKGLNVAILGLIVMIIWCFGSLASAAEANNADSGAVTIKTVFTFTEDPENAENIFLSGLATKENAKPSVLSVTWELQQQDWFSYWYLVLRSEDGLIPAEIMAPATKALQIGPTRPVQGHTYELTLSYHSVLGYLSLSFVDQTEGVRIGEGSWNIKHHNGELFGVTNQDSHLLSYPWYEPVTNYWVVGTGIQDSFMPTSLLENTGETVVRLDALGTLPGEYRVLSSSGAQLASAAGANLVAGQNWVTIPSANLPLGPTELMLQYVDKGKVMYSEARKVVVGKVVAALNEASLDSATHQLKASFIVQSESYLRNMAMQLQVNISAIKWNSTTSSYSPEAYSSKVVDLGRVTVTPNQPISYPVSLAVPDEPGLWRVDLRLLPDPAIKTDASVPSIVFSTQTWTVLGKPDSVTNSSQANAKTLRIGSYNILGFTGYPEQSARAAIGYTTESRHYDYYTNVLRSLNCDILGIQEGSSVGMMTNYANRLNMKVAAFPSATSFPGGVLSKYPVVEARSYNDISYLGSHRPFSRTGSAVLLNVDGKLLWVVNIHAHVNDRDLRKQEAEILDRELDGLLKVTPNMVVTGDFNSYPDEIIHETLRKHNLYNSMQILDLVPPNHYERAIDHIYVSANLVGYLQSGKMVSDPGFVVSSDVNDGAWRYSDHRPVVIELRWP